MKRYQLIVWSLIIGVSATAFKVADDILNQLGLQQEAAQRYIIRNFIGDFSYGPIEIYQEDGPSNDVYNQTKSFQIPYIQKAKLATLLSGDKAAAAKELCEYVKKYINSEEFIKHYKKLREEAMPLTDKGSTLANLVRDKEVFEKNIANYKTDTKYVAEQQKLMEENQKRIDALLEAAKKPFPGKDKWEKLYPLDPATVIKKRLQEYLTLAATVDFNAKLTEPDKYKIKKFVNPVYEKKSLKWKAIYRAGKDVNDVVTSFIKEWLKGEIISANKTKMTESTSAAPININNPKPATTESVKTISTPTTDKPDEPVISTTNNQSKQDSSKAKKSLLNKVKGKIGF